MRVFSLLTALFLSISCNEIEGTIKVFSDFVLTDEDNRAVTIAAGAYSAEVEHDARNNVVELEIKDVDNGKTRDFILSVPSLQDNDLKKEHLEIKSSLEDGNLQARMVLNNTIIQNKGPYEAYLRCRDGSTYQYFPQIYFKVKRHLSAAVHIGKGEETLAIFKGTRHVKERDVKWEGECGEEMPEYEVHYETN